jgi:hypothetical protein
MKLSEDSAFVLVIFVPGDLLAASPTKLDCFAAGTGFESNLSIIVAVDERVNVGRYETKTLVAGVLQDLATHSNHQGLRDKENLLSSRNVSRCDEGGAFPGNICLNDIVTAGYLVKRQDFGHASVDLIDDQEPPTWPDRSGIIMRRPFDIRREVDVEWRSNMNLETKDASGVSRALA